MVIIIRLLAAIISSAIYSLYVSIKINQEILESFILYFSYTSIVYILGGVPASFTIYIICKKIKNSYRMVTQHIIETTMYVTTGGSIFVFFSIFFLPSLPIVIAFIFGALAALLYYIILLLLIFFGKLIDKIPQ